MLTSMCSALIDTPVSPGSGNAEDTTDQLVVKEAFVPVADADASVDVSSVITQYLGPNQPGVAAAKWQQVKLQSPDSSSLATLASCTHARPGQ